MAASDARPFPLRNTAYRVYFPILDADGDPVSGAANLDSEISKDAAVFADCTNEAVEIGASGMYYLDLTSTEIGTASAVVLTIKTTTSGAKMTPIVLYPVDLSVAQLGVNAAQAGGTAWGSGAITPGAIATDAIDGDALAASAVAEIQAGLATAAALQIVDDFVDELESRLSAARAGYLDNLSGGAVALASALATLAGYVDTEVAAIKAKTDNLPSDPADDSDIDAQLAAIAAYIDTEVAAIKAKTDLIPASPAAVGSAMTLAADAVNAATLAASAVAEIQAGLSTLTAGQVNAEVVDALNVDTYAEPGGVPGATASLVAKLGWLFALARNKRTTSASADVVRNDADSAAIGTATLTDDGSTFTRGEYA